MLLFLRSCSERHFSPLRSGLSYGRGGPHRMTENIQGLRPAALESSNFALSVSLFPALAPAIRNSLPNWRCDLGSSAPP